jgi:hypothetical protein
LHPFISNTNLTEQSYQDIISGDIILNDTFTLEEDGPTLITCTCRELPRTLNNADDIVENGACNNGPPIYDIEETFNLVRHKPEKADFKAQLNSMIYFPTIDTSDLCSLGVQFT